MVPSLRMHIYQTPPKKNKKKISALSTTPPPPPQTENRNENDKNDKDNPPLHRARNTQLPNLTQDLLDFTIQLPLSILLPGILV